MAVPLPMRLALIALAALAMPALAQELPPEAPPQPVVGGEQPPPDAPPPSAPPPRAAEATPHGPLDAPAQPVLPSQAEDSLPSYLRHLGAIGAAWGPVPSPDGQQISFVTTLFGSRQAAIMPAGGGYPVQLTDEPGGVLYLRWSKTDPHLLFAVALRAGQRRVLQLDDQGSAPREIDPSPGDQLFGGFTRDGKRLLFGVASGDKVALKWMQVAGSQLTEVAAPLPQQGTPPTPAGEKPKEPPKPLSESLKGIFALTAPTLDGRFALASVKSGADESLLSVDLNTTRTELLTPHEGSARYRQAVLSPDGRLAYVLTDAGRPALGIDVITLQTKQRKVVFELPTEVEAFALAEDGHKLVAAQASGGETLFTQLELPSLRTTALPQPPPGALAATTTGETPIAWSRSSDRIWFAWSRAEDTTDVYSLRSDVGSAQRITRSPRPGLPDGSLPRPRSVTFTSFDGRAVPGLLWAARPLGQAPKASAGPQPLARTAVVLTGGQARPNLDSRIAALSAINVSVLTPGVRGSEGRGKAHAASDAAGALQDVASSARFLRGNPEVDGSQPLLVGIGDGAAMALEAAERDPSAWSGLVLIGDHLAPHSRKPGLPMLALPGHGAQALAELAAFARQHLEKARSASR